MPRTVSSTESQLARRLAVKGSFMFFSDTFLNRASNSACLIGPEGRLRHGEETGAVPSTVRPIAVSLLIVLGAHSMHGAGPVDVPTTRMP